MTNYLLAGGGTAGHVNPLLAIADALTARNPEDRVLVLGTAEGLEARLVPLRGYELIIIPSLPFPRRLSLDAVRFGPQLRAAVRDVARVIESRGVDAVVGFGGYASTPAYLAAHRTKRPLVIHEANAIPGLANRLGSTITKGVGVAFEGTRLRHARFVGMPLRPEIEHLERAAARSEGVGFFGLDPTLPTVLVTGGSRGARRINQTVRTAHRSIVDAGYQIVHITGSAAPIDDPLVAEYHIMEYCDRMDLALAVADVAVSRGGSATVCELSALGIPAVYIPYPVGNGEQRWNARGVVAGGGGILVDDAEFTPEWVHANFVPLLRTPGVLATMGERAASAGVSNGTELTVGLIDDTVGR
jgi:UDP-N-acetylglucosamine--N-acetylmuramyl-(pentapeptide) pyrophosphoryl-undecaprenol N-acetylglucosamine transferase